MLPPIFINHNKPWVESSWVSITHLIVDSLHPPLVASPRHRVTVRGLDFDVPGKTMEPLDLLGSILQAVQGWMEKTAMGQNRGTIDGKWMVNGW